VIFLVSPASFVDFDHGVYNAIKKLREALGDSAEPRRSGQTGSSCKVLGRDWWRFFKSNFELHKVYYSACVHAE
jgi:hypothetical protein